MPPSCRRSKSGWTTAAGYVQPPAYAMNLSNSAPNGPEFKYELLVN